MIKLTKENASKVSTIRSIDNPEWGITSFNYNAQPLNNGKYCSTHGKGFNSACLSECEYHFWEVTSWKEGVNAYLMLKEDHQKEVNAFPLKFAFSNEQFEKAMAEWGLTPNDTDKIYQFTGTGGFYLRTDAERLHEMFNRHEKEMQNAIAADRTGEGFIFDMFNYELSNHEYVITHDVQDALDALGIDIEEVEKEPRLAHGLELAKKRQFED